MSSSLEAKIVVLGAQNVGKTSLVMRYCKGSFNPAQVTSTVGASFLTKRVVDNDSDTVVRLQIWDTAGQERFRSISRLYYRGANACILCYSITDAQSFTDMGEWLTELRRNLPSDVGRIHAGAGSAGRESPEAAAEQLLLDGGFSSQPDPEDGLKDE
ncbi:ras-domain-containing protein [Trichoderma longibrachiatum ATCC 18648]|uniref:Ras-domain-containing protein n=1 Tax=Trichoderma longibrachiatum ATCC 18648 TaxID=983965 RepID=A0A2T4CGB3_TRILO|nr:ras-domain-containing protein [Trichoderma longibrachiatum ATCC 18648]